MFLLQNRMTNWVIPPVSARCNIWPDLAVHEKLNIIFFFLTLYKSDLRIVEQILKFCSTPVWFRHTLYMYTYFTFISIVHSLTKATHAFHIIQLYLQFEIVEFGFSPTELSMAFLFSNLGEELLSQSEFTVVQTQHLHSAKQMGHLRRRRWSRGGGTGTNSLCISFLLTISKYICTCCL